MAQGQIVAEGPPDSVMGDQRVIDAYLGAHHDADLTFEEEEKILAEAEAELEVLASERLGGQETQEGERNE
jgi:branched-chain amino acid transport system ATP-binding protein